MGKYYFFAILLCSLTFSLKSQAAGFSGGKGTETEPYLIKTAQDLEDMADAITLRTTSLQILTSNLLTISSWKVLNFQLGVNQFHSRGVSTEIIRRLVI